MNEAPIKVESRTFVNNSDVKGWDDGSIFQLIAAEEAKIKELSAIEAKPKRLAAEIAKRQAGIKDLIAALDARDAK